MAFFEFDYERRSQVKKAISKAHESLKETELLRNEGFLNGSVTRAYSAMFHSAGAVLLSHDFDIIKPSAVVAFFDREITKKGLIEKKYQDIFSAAHEGYNIAEYDTDVTISAADAERMVNYARQFVLRMEKYLKECGW